jgi:hypothetical protein
MSQVRLCRLMCGMAMPRHRGALYILGYALGAAFGPKSEGLSPDQGHSPGDNLAAVGGA